MQRLNNYYLGLVKNEQRVIAYGGAGSIMISEDKGVNWRIKNITDDTLYIKKIILHDKILYAVCNKSKALISNDNGENWKNLSLTDSNSYNDIIVNNSFIFLLTSNNSIEVCDFNFKKIKEISLTNKTRFFFLFNDKILFPDNDGKLISMDTSPPFKLDSNDISAYGKSIYFMQEDEGILYCRIDTVFYKNAGSLDTWMQIATGQKNFKVYKGSIYQMTAFPVDKEMTAISFYKQNGSEAVKVNLPEEKRWVEYLLYDYMFVDENNIIAVGTNNTIMRSTNGGANWICISNFNYMRAMTCRYWVNENIAYFSTGKKIIRTSDGGATWLPQFYDTLYSTASYFLDKEINYMSFDSKGKGLAFGLGAVLHDNDTNNTNLIFTDDFKDKYNRKWLSELWTKPTNASFLPIKENDSSYIILSNWNSSDCIVFNLNKDLNKIFYLPFGYQLNFKKTESLINYAWILKNDTIKCLAVKFSYPEKNNGQICLISSADLGASWEVNSTIVENGVIESSTVNGNQIIAHIVNNSTGKSEPYLINLEDNSFKTIDLPYEINKIYFWNNKIIARDSSYEFYIIDSFNPISISKFNINPNKLKIDNLISFSDSVIYAELISTFPTLHSEMLRFVCQPETKSIEFQKNGYPTFYSAYPTPCINEVSCSMTWDKNFNQGEVDIKVFNSEGKEVLYPGDIRIIQKSEYIGEVKWNCSGMQNGLYYIRVKFNDKTRSAKVLIQR